MAGLDLILAIHDTVLKDLEASPNSSPLLKEKVKKGELGFKSGKGFYKQWTAGRHQTRQGKSIKLSHRLLAEKMRAEKV